MPGSSLLATARVHDDGMDPARIPSSTPRKAKRARLPTRVSQTVSSFLLSPQTQHQTSTKPTPSCSLSSALRRRRPMPPSPPPPLIFFSILFLLTATSASTIHAQPSRRLLQSAPPPPHPHHRHHTPRSPPSPSQPSPTPTPPTPTPQPAANPSTPPNPTPPPTPIPTPPPPAPRFTSASTPSSATPTPDNAYPFTNNYPFFPTASPPPPPPPAAAEDDASSRTFPANISTLVAPSATDSSNQSHRFPVLQAVLLAFISLCLLLLSALLAIHLFRRLRRRDSSGHHHRRAAGTPSASSSARQENDQDEEDGDEEGRSLKPPPMPTSSTNPSTEFLYLGTLASSNATPPPGAASSHARPGSPELRPLPTLPRVGPPSGEFFAAANNNNHPAAASISSSSLSPSSPSASSPTLGSSPAHHIRARAVRPPSIPLPRGRAPSPDPSPPPHAWNPFVPAPPPPPQQHDAPASDDDGGDGESYTTEMRKSRPLHSDKLKPVSLHMKDEMIQMYLNTSAAASREVCVLGAARCHGVGAVLAALGVSEEQVRDALLEGNAHGLGVEALRMLSQLVVSNEEELKLRYFKDDPPAKLCPVDAFLKTILDVPFAFKRVDAMLYVSNFYLEVNQLRMSYATLEAACQELRSSRLFHKVLGAVLNFGNLMSINTGSPNSHALEPNTLLKIVDVKGADRKAALLQFVVQEIMKPEGHSLNPPHSGPAMCKTKAGALPYDVDSRKHGLQVVSRLAAELTNTKKAASIDITSLSRTVSELGVGLGKIHDVLRLNSMTAPSAVESARRFHGAMSVFLRQAEEEVLGLQGQESACLSSVREMAEYFHGGDMASGDEAHMFRVFTGVREFVAMLDMICREAAEVGGDRVGSTAVNWMAAAPVGMTATP